MRNEKKRKISPIEILQAIIAMIMLFIAFMSLQISNSAYNFEGKKSQFEYFNNFLPTFSFSDGTVVQSSIGGENIVLFCFNVENVSTKDATHVNFKREHFSMKKESRTKDVFTKNGKETRIINSKLQYDCSLEHNADAYEKNTLLTNEIFFFSFYIFEKDLTAFKNEPIYNFLYFRDKVGTEYAITLEFIILTKPYAWLESGDATKMYYKNNNQWELIKKELEKNKNDLPIPPNMV